MILKNKFKIIIPTYNSTEWLSNTLSSIENQSYRNYEVCIIDDASTDSNQVEIINSFSKRLGWRTILNKDRKGALANIVNGIAHLECRDEDIIILIDGDDWLYDKHVLNLLNLYYNRENVYLTYGQWISFKNRTKGRCARVTEDELIGIRKGQWRFSHLRTFKYLLWKNIKDGDLRDSSNEYFKVAWDLAIMFPLFEMAPERSLYVPDILYVYNDKNPINDFKVRVDEQSQVAKYISENPQYQKLAKMPDLRPVQASDEKQSLSIGSQAELQIIYFRLRLFFKFVLSRLGLTSLEKLDL